MECFLGARPWAKCFRYFISFHPMKWGVFTPDLEMGKQRLPKHRNMYKVTNLVGGKAGVWMDQWLARLRHQSHHCSVWFRTEVDSGFWLILTSHQNSVSFPGSRLGIIQQSWFCSSTCMWIVGWSLQNAFIPLEKIGLEAVYTSLCLQALEVKGRFKENFKKGGFESHVFPVI